MIGFEFHAVDKLGLSLRGAFSSGKVIGNSSERKSGTALKDFLNAYKNARNIIDYSGRGRGKQEPATQKAV